MTEIRQLKQRYSRAHPYPHIVLDNFLHPARAECIMHDFPTLTDLPWYVYDNVFEQKYAYNNVAEMPQTLSDLLWELNAPPFVAFLEELTGIPSLVADDSFHGGGLHCVAAGGKLDVHADFNIHPISGLHRRLNVILFLNKAWRPEYGGALELWSCDMTTCVERIFPCFNRMLIFTITDTSFHGHPEPLCAPHGMLRKSMAWYYYTSDRPENEKAAQHSTLYQRRPGDPNDAAMDQLRVRRATGRLRDAQLALVSGMGEAVTDKP